MLFYVCFLKEERRGGGGGGGVLYHFYYIAAFRHLAARNAAPGDQL